MKKWKKEWKRMLALLLAVVLVGTGVDLSALTVAAAETIAYVDADGVTQAIDAGSVSQVKATDSSWGSADDTSWYYVEGTLTGTKTTITVLGDVHLILTDGSSLTTGNIYVASGNSLTIYGQEEGTGSLVATSSTSKAAGIGGASDASGTITINGGTVEATGNMGAGIGGGYNGTGTVIINGGTVKAQGGNYAAGIGGGYNGTGTVTIHGGMVEAASAIMESVSVTDMLPRVERLPLPVVL